MTRWVIADLHLRHKNILKYEPRPYPSIEEHDEALIANWNNVVRNRDEIWVLGDFSLAPSAIIKDYINRLKGIKHIIIGNHDKSATWYRNNGFIFASKYPIIMDKFFIFSHKPVYLNEHMPYANLHGHLHSKTMESSQYYSVSVEQIGYKPANLDNIFNYLRKLSDN